MELQEFERVSGSFCAFHAEYAPDFGRRQWRENSEPYLRGLLVQAEERRNAENLRVLYVGEGNNSAAALALALARFPGNELYLRTPAGYGLAEDKLAQARRQAVRSGSCIEEGHDMSALPAEVDIVYTTRWQTTGTTKPDADWHERFEPFQVDRRLMARWPDARFMHDLPAHRGEEVTAEVLDGPASLALPQAANKYHTALSILEWCLAGRG